MSVRSCNHTCTLIVNATDSLMVDSTDFRTRGNENAASIIQSVGGTARHAEQNTE